MKSEKITDRSEGPARRRYNDSCAAAHALDLVGERWALLVMRELMIGPKRFTDLRASLPGISANVLTQRLGELEAAGIVERAELPPPAAARVYQLTEWGLEAEPVLQTMGRWAARSPRHDPSLFFSTASLVLSLRTMFSPARAEAEGVDSVIALVVGPDVFRAHASDMGIEIERGAPEGADVRIAGNAQAIAAAIYGGVPVADLEAAGALQVAGDRGALAAFVTLFPLPPKAVAPPI